MLASEYSTSISNAHQLQLMAMAPAASYTLGANINAAATGLIGGVMTDVWGSAGFVPVGNSTTKFTGTFDGLGHTISNLTINLPSRDRVGLFGATQSATVANVGLVNVNITGGSYVGALIGDGVEGDTHHSYATGLVNGVDYVGGLIGYNNTMQLNYSYTTANVNGANRVGGLIGSTNGGITVGNDYASGKVTATGDYVGGLVGENGFATSITQSYATGEVSGRNMVGGLAGYSGEGSGSISNRGGPIP
jgi:hypothetical protein